MSSYAIKGLLFALFLIGFSAHAYSEQQSESLESRIARLERVMNSQKQLEFLFRVKQVKQENQQLRNLIEKQTNEIRLLKQSQQKQYIDFNKRIEKVEERKPEINKPIINKSMDMTVSSDKVEVVDKSISVSQPLKIVIQKTAFKAEQNSYQKAYNELIAHQYNKARNSFVQFIKQYPHGRYAHIAQYWIAEASYAQHNYEQAIIDYQQLIDHYAVSPKKAESELKKAYCYYELDKKDIARGILNNILKKYPNSTGAEQAKGLLKKL